MEARRACSLLWSGVLLLRSSFFGMVIWFGGDACCAGVDCLPRLAITSRLVLGRSVHRSLRRPSSLHSHHIHHLRQGFGASNRARYLPLNLLAQMASWPIFSTLRIRVDGAPSKNFRLSESTLMPLRSCGRFNWPPGRVSIRRVRSVNVLVSNASWTFPDVVDTAYRGCSPPGLSGSSRALLGEYSSSFYSDHVGTRSNSFCSFFDTS